MFDTQFSTVKRDIHSDISSGSIFIVNEDNKRINLHFFITQTYLDCSPVVRDYVENLNMRTEEKALTFVQNIIKQHTDYLKEFFKSTNERSHMYVLFFCANYSGFD